MSEITKPNMQLSCMYRVYKIRVDKIVKCKQTNKAKLQFAKLEFSDLNKCIISALEVKKNCSGNFFVK